ncbi:hypothetical protein AA103196_0558 [Ameyamaea chiangmaiensis NBRC 103196]|uniref:Discoidin domain-containing protein n=1 Tax=Ameyamaea chiangmaiensis TaxID=442969 RepID=A0A850PB07_9PROT|nr:discoidin domain-containing protein [Ameyamaea chiangmaiensis]MBS4074954.1 discoidin domain-containing protein [Ameyamaea chiangmaiensis]NVN39720.1 discoidin domain-containing protein [Ameyamaea chiangmaiensis]GBQ63322.1 hypothetical protein AA103196_0558 [Ameyamaea chiangmaiensis NBRC 103196]
MTETVVPYTLHRLSSRVEEDQALRRTQESRGLVQGQDYAFHTRHEYFPWCDVDLLSPRPVSRITLENTHFDPQNLQQFSLLGSDDGIHWTPLYAHTDWTIPDHHHDFRIEVVLPAPRMARFLRVRVDALGCLHLRGLTVLASDTLVPTAHDTRGPDSVVFATNFNESDEFLDDYIDNFLSYSSESCRLVVNFPAGRTIPPSHFAQHTRISLFNGSIERSKWGISLLLGHSESFQHAKTVFGTFDYFCTMASNSLFVRPVNIDAAIALLPLRARVPIGCERNYNPDIDVDSGTVPHGGTWAWKGLQLAAEARDFMRDVFGIERYSATQIEGLFATTEDWAVVFDRHDDLVQLGRVLDTCRSESHALMALEECLPPTLFEAYGSGRYTHLCRVLWHHHRAITLAELLAMPPRLPDHISALKWFQRDRHDLNTALVVTGNGRALLDLLHAAASPTIPVDAPPPLRLTQILTHGSSSGLRSQPLSQRYWRDRPGAPRRQLITTGNCRATRQRAAIELNTDAGLPDSILWYEDTSHRVQGSVLITETDRTRLQASLRAWNDDGTHVSADTLEAYLYLPLSGSTRVLRITDPRRQTRSLFLQQIMPVITRVGDFFYEALPSDPRQTDHGTTYDLPVNRQDDAIPAWLGLPLFARTDLRIEIEILTDHGALR